MPLPGEVPVSAKKVSSLDEHLLLSPFAVKRQLHSYRLSFSSVGALVILTKPPHLSYQLPEDSNQKEEILCPYM